jgi:hypothetical protein
LSRRTLRSQRSGLSKSAVWRWQERTRKMARSEAASAIEGGKMTAEKTTMAFGWRVYGLGVVALGMLCLAWGDFDPGQPVPKAFPDRTALAYVAAAFMLVAGAAVEWRRTAAWGAAALAAYYALIVVILMNGRLVLAHYAEFGTYSGVAEQLAIAWGNWRSGFVRCYSAERISST